MKIVRIPDEGEIWYNTKTKHLYIFRDNVFKQLDTNQFHLIPNDTVNVGNYCVTEKVLSYTFDPKTWIPLIEVSSNDYQWLPDFSEARIPKTEELWYSTKTGGYYVVDKNGVFVLVYLFVCAQVSLKRGIVADKYVRDDNAKNGFAGWRFVSKNWKEYLMNLFKRSLNTPEKVLFGETVQIK